MIAISRYSGKCDVYDVLVNINEVKDFSKIKIYARGNGLVPLRIDCQKDLIPYYPYLTSLQHGDKDGNICIWLRDKSYVDEEEEEVLTWKLKEVLRYWKKCKRKHEPFDKKKALELINFYNTDIDYLEEIVNRVEAFGKKATIDGLHIPTQDHYRKELYETMVEAGYTDDEAYRWCFGWYRWAMRLREKEQ